jgi:hypothetical protein
VLLRPTPVDSSSGACAVLSTHLCWRGPARWVPLRHSCRHCCRSSTPPHARVARRVDMVQCCGCCCDDPSSLMPVGRRGPCNPGVDYSAYSSYFVCSTVSYLLSISLPLLWAGGYDLVGSCWVAAWINYYHLPACYDGKAKSLLVGVLYVL